MAGDIALNQTLVDNAKCEVLWASVLELFLSIAKTHGTPNVHSRKLQLIPSVFTTKATKQPVHFETTTTNFKKTI